MDRAAAARRLGMKTSEIVAVVAVDGGFVATNHVGGHTLIADTGELQFGVADPDIDQGDDAAIGIDAERRPPGGLEVPPGPVAVVMEWVDADHDQRTLRAVAALAVEQAAAAPRKTLLEQLAAIVGAGQGDG